MADRLGVYNMLVSSLSVATGLVFAIFGVHSFAGIAAFGAVYGCASGACKRIVVLLPFDRFEYFIFADVSLIPMLVGKLTTRMEEAG